jgi:hypothetical protein
MEDPEKKPVVEKIVETSEDILETYRRLICITLVEYTSLGAGMSVVGLVYTVFVVFTLLFAGLGAAWWIGESMNDIKSGFFIIAGFYAFVFLLFMGVFKKKIIPLVRNKIIKQIYEAD